MSHTRVSETDHNWTVSSAYYCDILQQLHENLRRLCPELWLQENRLLRHKYAPSHTSFFTREYLTKNRVPVVLHPFCVSDFARCDFPVSATEDTAILKQLRLWRQKQRLWEHPHRSHLPGCITKMAELLEWCICGEGDYFKDYGGSRSKIRSWPDGSTSLRN
jgi:hypothetical protein